MSPSVWISRFSRVIPRTAHCATYPTIMQALSAASRCSCGLANRFVPPNSLGSSMSIEKRRGTCSPPIPKPSICARLRVWPCQVVVTRQFVLLFAASRLTPSISANRSSRLMPLTTVGSAVIVWATMISLLCWVVARVRAGSLQCGERRLDALALVFGDQAGKHLAKMRVLGARVDVLPAVSLEECDLDCPRLGLVDRAAALGREVTCVGFGLGLQDAVDSGRQFDELVDRPVAFLRCQPGVVAHPLEFVEDRVLQFVLPVIEEHVLEQFGELGVGINAPAIVELSEQLDIQRQCQHRPCTLAEYSAGDGIGVDVESVAVG